MLRHCLAGLCLALLPLTVMPEERDPITVGLLLDLDGPYSLIAGRGSLHAARMAIEDVDGEVLGRPVEIIHADHGNSVERAERIARDWLENQQVDIIADTVGSPVALAVQEINRDHKAVLIFNAVVSKALTNEACATTSFHWMYDSYMFSRSIARLALEEAHRDWFVLYVDNAYGQDSLREISTAVEANGGNIIGTAGHSLGDRRMLRHMIEAEEAGADVLAIASAGDDLQSAVKQAFDLHSVSRGDMLVTPVGATVPNIREAGLGVTQGMVLATPFYWDQDDTAREWSGRFQEYHGRKPSEPQAGVYSALTHYFRAVDELGTAEGELVARAMRDMPVSDPVVRDGFIRADGRLVQDIRLVEMKSPTDSAHEWDVARVVGTVPGKEAFKPLSLSDCPLVSRD